MAAFQFLCFALSCSSDLNEKLEFQALLHSVPLGRLVVLDLFAEVKPLWPTSDQFYGIPYIWQVIIRFPSFLLYVKDQRPIQSTINSSWLFWTSVSYHTRYITYFNFQGFFTSKFKHSQKDTFLPKFPENHQQCYRSLQFLI